MNKTETRKIIEQELEKATGPSNSDIQPDEEALLVVPAEEEKTFSEPPVGLEGASFCAKKMLKPKTKFLLYRLKSSD